MLAAVDHDRTLEERRRTDPIRAAKRFRPKAAGPDISESTSVSEALVGNDIEQHTFGRRKGDEEIRTCNLIVQCSHFRERKTAKQDTLLLFGTQDLRARQVDRRRPRRIEAKRNAPQPALIDF